jgi:hypothetical protein
MSAGTQETLQTGFWLTVEGLGYKELNSGEYYWVINYVRLSKTPFQILFYVKI